jgi:hypothetical protein
MQAVGIESTEKREGVERQKGKLLEVAKGMANEEFEGAGKDLQGAVGVESADGDGGRGGRGESSPGMSEGGMDGAKQSNGIDCKERGEGVDGQNGMLPKVTEDVKKEEELEGAARRESFDVGPGITG